jgi:membrane dipeptidase
LTKLNAEFGLPQGRGGRGGAGGGGRGRGRGAALAELTEERRHEYQTRLAELNRKYPSPPRATVQDFVDHIDYVVKKIGIDHVGISSDFDGGGGVEGWDNAAETVNVTIELVRRGYTEQQIAQIWGGNLLSVMDRVAKVAAELQKNQPPASR